MRAPRVARWLALLLGACAGEPETRLPVAAPLADIASAAATPQEKPLQASNSKASRSKSAPRASNRQILALMEQSTRPINIADICSFRNETGYNGTARIGIRDSQVSQLSTLYDIP